MKMKKMKRLAKKDIEDIAALTPMQEGMLYNYLKSPESDYYFEQLSLDISGEINVEAFEGAWNFVVEINEMLRTVFRWEGIERPVQIILKQHTLQPTYYDFSGKELIEAKKQLEEVKTKDRKETFALNQVPFRVTLCKVEKDRYEMIISNHHILYDGWSNGIILKEFFNAYDDLSRGKELVKPEKTKFKEFIKGIQNRDFDKEKKFWAEYLKDVDTKTGILLEKKPGKTKDIKSTAAYRLTFPEELKETLNSFIKSYKVPLSALLYSAWGMLLLKYNSREDIVFDTTVSGRFATLKGIEEIVGLFINTVPLRVKAAADERVSDFISWLNDSIRQREEFENSSPAVINEYLDENVKGNLFDSVVVVENYPLDKELLTGREFSLFERTRYDLTVIIITFGEDIEVHFTYNQELFDEEIMAGLSRHFVQIVQTLLENPRGKISTIDLKLDRERSGILDRLKRSQEEIGVEFTYKAPRDEVEEKLVRIWSALYRLDKSEISMDTNFFDLGGHSLKAALLSAEIHKEFGVKISLGEIFRSPTIRKLAEYIHKSPAIKGTYEPVKPVEKKEYYRLTPAQRRFYMLQQLNPESTVYNGPFPMVLQGDIDNKRIAASFERLIRRYEILRTSFEQQDGEPVQRVHSHVEFEIDGQRLLPTDFIRPFDLSKASLLRVGWEKLEEQRYLLMIDMHHIITDGTSSDILTREFTGLYNGESLSPLKIQYKDFSEWQNERLVQGTLKIHEDYWLKHFSGELPVLNMPTDFPRPMMQSFDGERIPFELDTTLTRQLRLLMKKTGTTLYMVLMAVFSTLLSWYSGQEDILVGVPVAGRNHADLEDTIGLFLETLVIRCQPAENKTFKHFLQEVKHTTLTANEHQDYPFSELVKKVATAKTNDLSRNPLFDVMLNVLNQNRTDLEIEGVRITPHPFDAKVSKVDITLEAVEKEESIELELEYCTALFKRSTMERFVRHFFNVLKEAVDISGIRLGDMEIIIEKEKRQILGEFNNTTTKYAANKTFMEYFEIQVEKNPEKTAVIDAENSQYHHVTYRQLNRQANRLARLLRNKGVEPDTIVGIMMDRSPWLIVGLLGILKSGGAYLPLDPEYPADRLEYMLNDSRAPFLVTGEEFLEKLSLSSGPEVIMLEHGGNDDQSWESEPDTNPAVINQSGNLAYVIYTSGSTGKPKGVMVRHKNLTAYIHAFTREFEIKETDVVLQQGSYSFDAFVEEVFPCLVKGGTLALLSRHEVRDTILLSRFIAANKVSIIDCSPLLLNEINRQEQERSVGRGISPLYTIHTFISGGDILKREYIRNLLNIGSVYNTYGPTETTVCATYHRLSGEEDSAIPIGKPIANYRVYILDRYHRLLPIGVPGEICISGAGVTRGYLNQPELTAERFIGQINTLKDTKRHEERELHLTLYKTGDLGRWLSDGSIEFLGRKDRQVNIRGFRIELDEIETQLLAHKDIVNAAAVVTGDNQNTICAYFTAHSQKTVKEIRAFLSKKLPDYMIPAYYVQLEEFPLGAGGKISTKALPESTGYNLDTGVEYVPPKDKLESRLVGLWQELLGLEGIGTADDFFDLGGDSILANRCIAAIREKLDVEIPLRKFFERPCIKALAEGIEVEDRQAEPESIFVSTPTTIGKAPKDVDIPLSFPQEHLWFLQNLDPENTAYFVPRVIRIKGQLEVELLERTFTEIIRRHEILRTVFIAPDGKPVQRIQPPYQFKIPVLDWSRDEETQQSQKVSQWVREEGQRPFDFKKGPLLRVTLLKLKEHEHLLVLTEHHLVHDGWTQGVLLKEFTTIFNAYLEGREHGLAELPIQYADFVYWQRNYLQGDVLENHLAYWKEKLAGVVQFLELPADRPQPPVMSGRGALKDFHLSASLTRQLKDFSRKHGVTLFMTMLAVFKVLLYRYTGVEDLCVGTGIANRRYKEIESMLGMVINTLPLRTQAAGDIPFMTFLHQVRETCLEAYQHQDTPFGKIVEVMEPERSLSYNPLFQVMFSFMDTPTENLWLPGLELHLEPSHNRSSKFDINVVVVPPVQVRDDRGEEAGGDAGETLVEWEYNTDIFDDFTMDRMLNRYVRLLEEVVNHPGKEISVLPILEPDEINRLLYEWNQTDSNYPKEKTLDELFEEQAARTPEKIAVVGSSHNTLAVGNVLVTYAELNRKSNQVAHVLKEEGVLADDIVAIMMARSVEVIIGILGILKAGGVYLPITPDYPQERIDYMLKDSEAKVLLTNLSEGHHFHHSSNQFINHHSGTLAYVIYTSGTTGRPRGTLVEHRSLVNLCYWHNRYYGVTEKDHATQYASLVFDASVWEIFPYLIKGASLHIIDESIKLDIDELNDYYERHNITISFLPTQLCEQFMEGDNKSLRALLTGGDKLRKFIKKGYDLYNNYGPTENTVVTAAFFVDKPYQNIPIGRPIHNNSIFILNTYDLKLQPMGVVGELCIGGDSLSRGYLNNPELTAEKFVDYSSYMSYRTYISKKIYKTGDLARWLEDGNIEFTGRIDHQVKVRGFRIEPGEIESHLLKHPCIKEAFVLVREDNKKGRYLCAYIIAAGHERLPLPGGDENNKKFLRGSRGQFFQKAPPGRRRPGSLELWEYLSQTLPAYMIPSYFVYLDKIPLTLNGKVDRKALPEPELVPEKGQYTAPRDEVEIKMTTLWAEVLGLEKEFIGIDRNFFELGGHSLKATMLA
ncbi:MAG: amino acid adenylation domain-containing protein, partial [Candidatus Aminicenantes bacterium]|nr:amino acid adenylation domain-containing protein [Candidatus Aminicenantes bacterium]NIQ66277.1 amino acid adenylation domain-containing protein [Candidatus Aminicenantes bacterium]NIT22284.1 amino acid adenylation domain-containing protein [Candidatus Aminicenantes bacterium]